MKIRRRMTVLCLAMVLAVTAYIPQEASAAKKVKLNKKNVSLKVGKKVKLKVKNAKKKVKWSVKSGKKYISLTNKKKNSVTVKAKKPGTAKVQAKAGKKKLVCKIKITAAGSSGKKSNNGKTDTQRPVTGTPGKNVPLPDGATVFTMGSKKLAVGMTEQDVNTVLGTLSNQEIRKGKSPQGFDTIAFNTANYQEYLLIYLKDGKVSGICGIGKSMSFGDITAGANGNNLSADWKNINDYKTASGTVAAKKKKLAFNEMVYAFFDVLADNNIYCIQVFDPTKVKDADHDMIYMTENLSYDAAVTASIAEETGRMLNAYRTYRSLDTYYYNDGLVQCAQNYCSAANGTKLDSRKSEALLTAILSHGVDPMAWGEVCYYGAADAVSFANSLIELESYYPQLAGAEASKYAYIGVGMATNGKHSYLALDYVDALR